ncbi:MAG: folate-binding protein YgfZ [Magnetococcales bacterium]|nr:folate-binding protein YgfZ [Magnetococcales bacterium]
MSLLESFQKTSITWVLDRGKQTPQHFGNPELETKTLLEEVALVDFSHRGAVSLSGADRAGFLGGLVSNQVKDLKTDRSLYTAMLSPQGRFLWDFTLVDHGETILLDTEPDAPANLVNSFNFYKMRSKVAIQDASPAFATLGIIGPSATQKIFELFSVADADKAPPGATWSLDGNTRLWRDPRHPDFGFRLQCPTSGFTDLWQRLQTALPCAGHTAWENYRVLKALPRGGSEWQPGETLLLEAGGLEMNAVSFQKGCYVGQETTARTHHRGTLKKRLFRVTIHTQDSLPVLTPLVLRSGKEAGSISSLASFDGHTQGLALLRLADVVSGEPMTALGHDVSVARPQWATWELP